MIGAALAHYRITAALGAGGMGEVWRAEDTKLGREVALKVLSEEFASDPQRLDRFEREARAVAALNHPHIVTIHSVEEVEGVRFLTMELIEGRSLDKLIPEGGLELESFFKLATPLAEAISAAHAKSVIHRDLKPSNVMVDGDGRVKVLDFGLAKLQQPEEVSDPTELPTEALTGLGVIVGTVPYMSPEQIEGKIVDHRTDIFSLGILLYEMAIGERPFSGASQPALMSSILKDVPEPVVELRSDLPRHLGRIIGRCLEKDRRDRYQTARDVFNELKILQREASSMVALGVRPAAGPSHSAARPPSRPADPSSIVSADEGFWVAALPFKYTGDDADLAALAEGLSEDIVTGLSRFSYLEVISRSSTLRYADAAADVRSAGRELGARYVMEGSLRRAGRKLRVAVQLVDTESCAHLWAEAYDRDFDKDDLFVLQDDLVPRIVSTCADHFGVLARAISEAVRGKPVSEMTSYEALMRGFGYHFRLSPDEHAEARDALERAVEQDPANADCQAMLAWVYAHEVAHGFNPGPGSLDRALAAARKAVDLAPSNHLAQQVLAVVFFFRGETAACRSACERALALNPLDGSNEAIFLTCFTGDWERGCVLIRRAMDLNPHHPPWYVSVLALDEYRRENYRGAVEAAVKANAFDLFWTHWLLAAAYGQLGDKEAACMALDDLLALKPDFAETGGEILRLWFQPELAEHFVDGLRKAGLDLVSGKRLKGDSLSVEKSGPAASEAPSIAVLPFTNMSADRDNEYFSDGLSEEIINALSRLSGLRVIARSSAFRFRGEQDLREVGEALGVRNVLEGSVRKADERLRITAQLVDVTDGSHIWSERFDREMTDVFEIQDEIAGAIVEKLHVSLGASEPARRQTANVAAYEALLEGRHHFSQFTPESTERALVCFRRALSLDPDYPDALTFSAFYHLTMAYMFENPREMLPNTREFAERALQADPNHGEARAAVAVVSVVLDHDWSAGEPLFQQALEAAPASARVHELYGLCWLLGKGRFDEALAELDLAIKLDPLSALYAGNRGRVLTCSRRFAEAQDSCRRGLTLDSRQLLVQVELTYALLFDGQVDEAIAVGERAIETHGPVNAPRQALALSYALAGRRGEAFELVDETAQPDAGYRSPLALGLVHAAFDEMDEAFAFVEQSFEDRDPLFMYLAVHPMFDTLRSDQRYTDLLRRMNLLEGDDPAELKSIVVLPFANLSPDPDAEYFSDGLTDEIITDLSRVRSLRVISRSSAMRLKGDERGLAEIGCDLDCRYVLEGSVRRAADNLRITTRLVDAPNDVQLWSDKFRGTLDDVFDIQERVSRSIVDALEIQLTPQEAEQLAERPIDDIRAQESYLRARNEIWSFMPCGLELAISHLDAALELIGDNALIYQGLGEAYFQFVNIGAAVGREEELIRKAEDCVDKIFALEPDSPRGHLVRGQTRMARGDIHGCGRSFRRVLQTFPNEIVALQLYTHTLGWLGGKPETAAPVAARLVDLDPLNPMSLLMNAMVPLFAGRFQEAVEPARRMFELDPVTPVWRSNYAMALGYAGRLDEAEELTEKVDAQPDSDIGTWWMGLCRATWREDRAEVLRLADGKYRQVAEWDAEIPWALATAHAAVGAVDEAMHWLDRAIDQGMINYPFLSEHDRYLDTIRGDERYKRAMERARREWERFDV